MFIIFVSISDYIQLFSKLVEFFGPALPDLCTHNFDRPDFSGDRPPLPSLACKTKTKHNFLRKSERIYLELTMTMWRSSRISCGAIVGGGERVTGAQQLPDLSLTTIYAADQISGILGQLRPHYLTPPSETIPSAWHSLETLAD